MSRSKRALFSVLCTCGVLSTAGLTVGSPAGASPGQPSSRVLLVGSGPSDPTTAAWQSALNSEGVAYTMVTATGDYGVETVTLPALTTGGVGNFNAVVLADSPTAFADGQLSALDTYESTERRSSS